MAPIERPAVTTSFYKGLATVASIAVGVLYIEHHISATIDNAIAPVVRKIESMETSLSDIKPKVLLNEYKIGLFESSMKEFLKPDEPKPKKIK